MQTVWSPLQLGYLANKREVPFTNMSLWQCHVITCMINVMHVQKFPQFWLLLVFLPLVGKFHSTGEQRVNDSQLTVVPGVLCTADG